MTKRENHSDPFEPNRRHVLRMLNASLGPVLEVSKTTDKELSEMLFEAAESGLLPTHYTAACMEAGTRLAEKGGGL